MGDIAKQFNCSRVYILLLLRKYGLAIRNKSVARAEAKKKGKNVGFSIINENFFKNPTPEMAYVLSFIYSDGNIANALNYFSISQKEPEILYKINELMSSEHPVVKRKNQELYTITIGNRAMIRDLLDLGLTPNKSLDIKFPVLPENLNPHFIRGLFDGDGSIHFSKTWRVNFVSGSRGFLEVLENLLYDRIHVSKRPINTHSSGRAYEFSYFRIADLMKIYNYFYQSEVIQKEYLLQRKHEIFKKVFNWGEQVVAKNAIKRDRRYKL